MRSGKAADVGQRVRAALVPAYVGSPGEDPSELIFITAGGR